MSDDAILIHGMGMMGASLAWALVERGHRVFLHHRRAEAARRAEKRGLGRAVAVPEEADGVGLAVVCTPVPTVPDLARDLAMRLPDAIVTDIGSVKAGICRALDDLDAAGRFVGSHPMCGSHLQGQDHATADLYAGAIVVLTPGPRTPPAGVERVARMWRGLGCRSVRMEPKRHDDAVARASHLPHVLAALAARQLDDEALPLAASGFRDTSRVAAGAPELWAGIIRENAAAIRCELERSRADLEALDRAIAEDDLEAITAWLAAARDRRAAFDAGLRAIAPD